MFTHTISFKGFSFFKSGNFCHYVIDSDKGYTLIVGTTSKNVENSYALGIA